MTLRDGMLSSIGGMNNSIDTGLLRDDQYARGINISSRGGKPHTRPFFTAIDVDDSNFNTGKFFGSATYHLEGTERLVVGIAGKVLGINLSTLAVTDYTALASITMDTVNTDRYYFQQADKYMIVQDGTNKPLIIDDATAAQATASQVPVGTKMAFGHGRLFVVVSEVDGVPNLGERFFVAGDIMLPRDVSTLLEFTENEYLAEGGAFGLPNELGFITSMQFIRNVQSGQGLGSLVVLAQNGASAFAVNASRTNWKEIDISQVLWTNGGSYSPFAFVPVNNDLYYRSLDGIRSMGYSISTTSGQSALISNNPLSENVRPDLDLDNRTKQYYVSMVYHGDRILTTVNAQTDGTDIYFKGLVSIDSSVLSSMGSESPPIYDGIWTGLNVLELNKAIYNGEENILVFAKDGTSNCLYFIDDSVYADEGDSAPVCRLYTKSYIFQNPDLLKKFDYANLYINDIRGSVSATLYFRPKGYPLWGSCATGQFKASYDGVTNLAQRYRKLRLTRLDEYCDPVTESYLHKDVDFEFCIQWTGHAKIDKLLIYAEEDRDGVELICDQDGSTKALAETASSGVSLDDYEYEV